MTFPSKAFLSTAFLAAHVANPAPFARGEETSIDLDATAPFLDDDERYLRYLPPAPAEYLRFNSPSVVLSATFPDASLHALYRKWTDEFTPRRTRASERERALRKLIWLSNHERIERHNDDAVRYDEEGGGSGAGAGHPRPRHRHRHRLAHNDFSDMTNDEFRRRFYLGEYSPGVATAKGADDGSWISSSERKLLRGDETEEIEDEVIEVTEISVENDIPEYKNWNEEGAVTKVKNQWFCGA